MLFYYYKTVQCLYVKYKSLYIQIENTQMNRGKKTKKVWVHVIHKKCFSWFSFTINVYQMMLSENGINNKKVSNNFYYSLVGILENIFTFLIQDWLVLRYAFSILCWKRNHFYDNNRHFKYSHLVLTQKQNNAYQKICAIM